MRSRFAVLAGAALTTSLLLSGCGDKPQSMGKRKSDTSASSGADAAYTVGNWKAGDAAAWESQLKTRAQSQNEYSRDAAP
jgi:hypothetical protein